MLLAVGTDIIEIARIERALLRYPLHFAGRIFSEKEIALCKSRHSPPQHFAARWACKEAIAKCLGTGIGAEFGWLDVEILNEKSGKPLPYFSVRWKQRLGHSSIAISYSHCKLYAVATAIWHE